MFITTHSTAVNLTYLCKMYLLIHMTSDFPGWHFLQISKSKSLCVCNNFVPLNRNVKAMTELTWDYNYEVGSVPDKELPCYCGAANCRKRLL